MQNLKLSAISPLCFPNLATFFVAPVYFPTFDSAVRTTTLIWMMMRDIIMGILQRSVYLWPFAYKIVRVLSKSPAV